MATESEDRRQNGGSRPVPDPTVLTDVAIAKATSALRDYIDGQLSVRDERLSGIDEATKLRLEGVAEIRHHIDEKVSHVTEVNQEKFESIGTQFRDRDTLAQRESELNATALTAAFNASKEAVAAALTAQKEDAARRDESNQKAIDKSEKATAEKIDKLAELFTTTINGLDDKIGDLKDRTGRIENTAVGAIAQRTEGRQSNAAIYAAVGSVIGIGLFVLAIVGFVIARLPA